MVKVQSVAVSQYCSGFTMVVLSQQLTQQGLSIIPASFRATPRSLPHGQPHPAAVLQRQGLNQKNGIRDVSEEPPSTYSPSLIQHPTTVAQHIQQKVWANFGGPANNPGGPAAPWASISQIPGNAFRQLLMCVQNGGSIHRHGCTRPKLWQNSSCRDTRLVVIFLT